MPLRHQIERLQTKQLHEIENSDRFIEYTGETQKQQKTTKKSARIRKRIKHSQNIANTYIIYHKFIT